MEEKKPAVDIKVRSRGFTGFCGLEFYEIQDEGCTIRCRLRPEHLNPAGIAHGGLIATLTDVAAGTMALQADGGRHNIVTQSCNIHFLRPGAGEVLFGKSRVIRKGSRVCVVAVDCVDESGTLVAASTYEIAYLGER